MRIHTTISFPDLMITVDFIRPLSLHFLAQRTGEKVYGYQTGVQSVIDRPYQPEANIIVMLFQRERFYKGSLEVGKMLREAITEHLKYWTQVNS